MNKKSKILISVIAAVVLIIISFFAFHKKANGDNKVILFYGDGCQHCIKLEGFMKDNEVEKKVILEKKEVFNNKNNAALMLSKAKLCNIPTDQGMGVPFLWDGSNGDKCLVGDVDITQYFKDKAGIK